MKGQLFRRIIAMGLTICILFGTIPVGAAADGQTDSYSESAPSLYSSGSEDLTQLRLSDLTVGYDTFCDFLINEMKVKKVYITNGYISVYPVGDGGEAIELKSGTPITLSESTYQVMLTLGGSISEVGSFQAILEKEAQLILDFGSSETTGVSLTYGEETITLSAGSNSIPAGNTCTLRVTGKEDYRISAAYDGTEISLSPDQEDPSCYVGTFTPEDEGTLTIKLTPIDTYPVSVCTNLSAYGFVSIDGTEESELAVYDGDQITLQAQAEEGCSFYGWKVTSGGTTSLLANKETSLEITVNAAATYTALFEKTGEDEFLFRAGSNPADVYLSSQIEEALAYASTLTDKTVYLMESGTVSKNVTIPSGVTMLIPYSNEAFTISTNAGNLHANMGDGDNSAGIAKAGENVLYTLTIPEDVTVTLAEKAASDNWGGRLIIGGMISGGDAGAAFAGHTSGVHSEILLDGQILLDSGAVLSCSGYILGDGAVRSEGGTVYQPFIINDFFGADYMAAAQSLNQTNPFHCYTMLNIQTELELSQQGKLMGYIDLFICGENQKALIPVVADSAAIIVADSDTVVTFVYKKTTAETAMGSRDYVGRHQITVENGGALGYYVLSLDGGALVLDSRETGLPVGYNWTITLKDGEYLAENPFAIYPGGEVYIAKGASLEVKDDFFVYNGTEFPSYSSVAGTGTPNGAILSAYGYAQRGRLIVNGTLEIGGDAIFGGIIESEESGAEIKTGTAAVLSNTRFEGVVKREGIGENLMEVTTLTKTVLDAAVLDDVTGKIATLIPGEIYVSDGSASISQTTYSYYAYDEDALRDDLAPEPKTVNYTSAQTINGGWSINKTITLDYNGGSLNNETSTTITGKVGQTITVSEPSREGYTLSGWLGADEKTYSTPLNQMPPCDLTAQWTPKPYTITFVSMGGTTVNPITQDYNTLVTAPAAPTREGYSFSGWFTGANGSGTAYFTADTPQVRLLENLRLYANWTICAYPVVLNTAGGTLAQTHPDTAYGGTVNLSDYVPRKDGYEFIGWFTEDNQQIVTHTMKAEALEVTARYLSYLDKLLNINASDFGQNDAMLKSAREYYGKLNASQLVDYTGTDHQKELFAAIKEKALEQLGASIAEAATPADELLQDMASLSIQGSHIEINLLNEEAQMQELLAVSFLEKLFVQDEVVSVIFDKLDPVTNLNAGELMLMAAYAANGDTYATLDDYRAYLDAGKDTLTVAALDGKRISLRIQAKTREGISYERSYTLEFYCNTHTVSWLDEDGKTTLAETAVGYKETIKAPTVKKPGHTLVGWKDKAGNKVDLSAEKMGKAALAYTAVWEPVKLAVILDYGYDNITGSLSVTYGEAFGTLPEPDDREQYFFVGWFTKGGQRITPETMVTDTEDFTLNAHWDQILPPEPADYTALNEAVASVPSNTRGYTTTSVKVMNDAVAAVKYGLTSQRQGDVDAWTAAILAAIRNLTPKTLTITFDAGNGAATFSTKTVTYLAAFGKLPEAARVGYGFSGWFTAKEGGTKVTSTTVMKETDNMILYARYIEEAGDYSAVDRYLKLIEEAGDLSIYDDESLAKIRAAKNAVVRGLGAGKQAQIDEMARSLQRAWNERQRRKVSVTLEPNGGKCDKSTLQYRYGEPYTGLPVPSRNGYSFLGWFTAKSGGSQVDGNMLMKQLTDHTLYAQWQWYSADYDGVDRALARVPSDLAPYTDETRNELNRAVNTVEYGLGGEYQSRVDSWAEAINKAIDGLVKKTLVVSFDAAGGKVSPASRTVIYGSGVALPVPTRSGYSFEGWYTSGGLSYTESTEIKDYVTLYARWTPLPADYTEVNKAISAIPADLSLYTKASADGLKAARDAVKQGLSSEEQGEVDSWAAAIRGAIDALVRKLPFVDVKEEDWFYSYVSSLYYAKIVNGTGDGTTYSPNMVTDRAQMAVLLYRISGAPESSGKHPFVDVPQDAYFHDAVCWAYENGIVNGTGDGSTYSPYMGITREMFATMLYRLFGEPKLGGSLSGFPDGKAVSSWAVDGMTFAVETGIITGKGDGTLAPQAAATRAEVATMLQRYMDLVK